MRKSGLTTVGLLVAQAFCFAARGADAGVAGAQVQEIHRRNLFGLRDPVVNVEAVQAPPLPKILLTGITTILGDRRALLKELPTGADGRQRGPGEEILMILGEGQREGHIEVVRIDEKTGAVTVINSGTTMTLTLENDGPQLPVDSPPPPNGLPPGNLLHPPRKGGTPPTAGDAIRSAPPGDMPPLTAAQRNANPHTLAWKSQRGTAMPARGTPAGH